MSETVQPMPFSMPMFRKFVPGRIRPWMYVFLAVTFQFSGGLYLGTVNQMMGETALMREDLLMCLYANLAGMAIYFPLLFRMKFRFTNKTLLCAAAAGVLLCNLLAPCITFLPLLWLVCFIEGVCKIQGTFECMSNIQLWMTPTRDFTVFFPLLHIIILGSMQLSDLLAAYLMYYYHWDYMHLFISGLMMVDLLLLTVCTRHFRMFKKFPLFGVDWLGALLWAVLLLEIAYLFNYGDWYDWWSSPVICLLSVAIPVTSVFCIWRMFAIRHPFFEPKMWTYRHLLPILILITLVEIFLATENVLEEAYLGEVMHYGTLTSVQLDWPALAGVLSGCLFAYWWMHIKRFHYLRLIIIGLCGIAGYLSGSYILISADIHIAQLYPLVFCRGFAYAVLSVTFMTCLEEIMSFQHFFQALSVFNMLHMVMGGVVGAAIYTRGLAYYLPDNMARYGAAIDRVASSRMSVSVPQYMETFMSQMTEISVKQLYGWAAYACLFLLLLFLLYDAPIRREMKLMPSWRKVRKVVAESFAGEKKEE